MLGFNYLIHVLSLMLLVNSCSSSGMQEKQYVIMAGDNAQSEQWAEYLYNHLSNRTTDATAVIYQNHGKKISSSDSSSFGIYFAVVEDLKNNYCIKRNTNGLQIQVRSPQTALWIIYELIENIAEKDSRFMATDLPPASLSFEDNKCRDFDFTYKEPFFEKNLKPDYAAIAGNNNVEIDWGIWGHNLGKIATEEDNDKFFALVGGKINKKQLDFSSPELLKYLEEYIIDNYGGGEKKSYRFMITPNDNDWVCTGPKCMEAGNTKDDATPAVVAFVGKLAKRFPKHQFFLTAYRTTRKPPKEKLPNNVGVFLSTIDLPKGIALNEKQPKTKKVLSELEAWRDKTSNIYLWDYAANFDDYLTPLPILYGFQEQLKFFKSQDVKGIFLNASGYDYSPFGDLKTYVTGVLMKDATVDVDTFVRNFFAEEYPISGTFLAEYYLSLEKRYAKRNKSYNIYGGIRKSLQTYINAGDFVHFYDALGEIIDQAKGTEQKKLKKLYTALSYTRLQVAYALGREKYGYAEEQDHAMIIKPQVEDWLSSLKNYTKYEDLQSYKEEGGLLKDYVADWDALIAKAPYENLLMNTPIKLLSKPDEDYENPMLLNDGTPGFAQDYHQGWYLSSRDNLNVSFSTGLLEQANKIHLRFLEDKEHGIFPPKKIEILLDGKLIRTISSDQEEKRGSIVEYTVSVSLSDSKEMELKVYRKQADKSVLACDEIQILKR